MYITFVGFFVYKDDDGNYRLEKTDRDLIN